MTIGTEEGGRWQRLQPRERALVIIFGMLALLAVVYLLLFSGGEEAIEGFDQPTPRPTATTSPRPTASPTATSPPRTFEVFEGKDPFRPLVGAAPSDGGGTNGGTNGGTAPPPTGGPDDAQRVTLLAINGSGANRTATVQVDSTEYTVKEGETFAGSYRVKSLTSRCGTFVFGDEQFTLCVGQEVLK